MDNERYEKEVFFDFLGLVRFRKGEGGRLWYTFRLTSIGLGILALMIASQISSDGFGWRFFICYLTGVVLLSSRITTQTEKKIVNRLYDNNDGDRK